MNPWAPIEKMFPSQVCAQFKYEGAVPSADGRLIYRYRHVGTRRFLSLSEDGQAWKNNGKEYAPADLAAQKVYVFDLCRPDPELCSVKDGMQFFLQILRARYRHMVWRLKRQILEARR